MIPLKMNALLEKALPETTWHNRLIEDGPFRLLQTMD